MPVVWTVKIDEKVLSALEVNHLKKRLQAQDNSNKKRSSDVLLDSPCDVEKLLTRKRTRLENGKNIWCNYEQSLSSSSFETLGVVDSHYRSITLKNLKISLLPPVSAVVVIKTEPSVCVSVSVWTLSWLNRLKYGHKILHRDWPWWHLGRVWSSRSNVKVIKLKNVILEFWPGFSVLYTM